MKIRRLIIVTLSIFSILPAIFVTFICIVNFKQHADILLKENVMNIAKLQSASIENFFTQNIMNLLVLGELDNLQQFLNIDYTSNVNSDKYIYARKMLVNTFNSRVKTQPYIKRISLINKDNIIIASSYTDIIGNYARQENEMHKLKEKNTFISDIKKDDDFIEGEKYFVESITIYEKDEYQGYLIIAIDMSYFNSMVENSKFFKTGMLTLMDKEGNIASTGSDYLVDNISYISVENTLSNKWSNINLNESPSGFIDYEIDGIDKIGCYFVLNSSGWIVLSSVEWSELSTPIINTIITTSIIVTFVLGLLILITLIVIKYIFAPLESLVDAIKRFKNGEKNARFVYNKKNELGQIAEVFNEMAESVVKNEDDLKKSHHSIKTLTQNIPGGVSRCRLDDGFTFEFISEGYIKLLNCTSEQINTIYDNKFCNTIYPGTKDDVMSEIYRQFDNSNSIEVYYRVKCGDGKIKWLLNKGQMILDDKDVIIFDSVVVDITKQKEAEERSLYNESQYRFALESVCEFVFKINVTENKITSGKNDRLLKNSININGKYNEIMKELCNKYIHQDFRDEFTNIFNLNNIRNCFNRGSEKNLYFEYMGLTFDKKYEWLSCSIVPLYNELSNSITAIGYVINIDEKKTNEIEVMKRAQYDSLTELYNKGTVQSLIENCLGHDENIYKHAIMVIDIDNFKSINDNLGHLVGDYVLKDISLKLRSLFRSTDIIGRIGGDEFIVLIKNIPFTGWHDLVDEKAISVLKVIKQSVKGELNSYEISGSIGLAIFPDDGISFKELFEKADKALYRTKKSGKNNFTIYDNADLRK